MSWETTTYEREDLFRQVWAEPVMHVAKRMGISDVALAKICRRLGIPLPGRGYWARKAAGRAPSPPRLKPPKPGAPMVYVRKRYCGEPGGVAGEEIRKQVTEQACGEPVPSVPETLLDPHPLVARSLPILQRAESRLSQVLNKHRCLDIVACGAALDRACRIMDTVLRTLEAKGYGVEITPPKTDGARQTPSETLVHIGDSSVQIGIDEAIQKIPLPLPEPRKLKSPYEYVSRPKREYEYRPTGRLRLRIKNVHLGGAPETWSDRKGHGLESQLGEFLASVVVAAERQRLDRIEAERRRQEAIKDERRRRAIALHNDAYDALEEDVESRLKDWRHAREMEAFAQAVRARTLKAGRSLESESLAGRWLGWLERVVAYLDREATDEQQDLCAQRAGYELHSRFDWGHKLTLADALQVFDTPIDDLVRELEVKDQQAP
jgi:hypothetical protein